MKQVDLSKYTKNNIGEIMSWAVTKKDVREAEIREACRKAIKLGVGKFYVHSNIFLPVILEELEGSNVQPGTFIGTSSGGFSSDMKALETRESIEMGAKAIVNAIDTTSVNNNHFAYIEQDIKEMCEAAEGARLTLVLGVAYLTDDQIKRCCEICAKYKPDAIATAAEVNFFDGVPSIEKILLMSEVLKDSDVSITASGMPFPYAQNAYTSLRAGCSEVLSRNIESIIEDFDQMRDIGLIPPYVG